jgi:peptide/nickel transport system ATP-binding protein
MNGAPLLEVEDLRVAFHGAGERVEAVRGLSFALSAGEILGVVGESGSGKSATALALLGLLPKRVGALEARHVVFEGRDLTKLDEAQWNSLRGRRIALVPQDPMAALNPTLTIERQFWLIQRRTLADRAAARAKARDMLARMGLPEPERMLASYPFQLSGGQRQRVLIAAALINGPALLIADEPTTALDVTVQAEILALIEREARERMLGVIFITHSLGVAWRLCDRILVMRAGAMVECGAARDVLGAPREAYTRALIAALPGASPPRTRLAVAEAPP